MKTSYTIVPILTCRIMIDKGMFTYLRNYGQKILVPVYAWLIQGGDDPILVDAGCSLEDFMTYAVLATGGDEGLPIEESLDQIGVSASQIKTVVMTHLHADHCLNARKFPNAKIVVQEDELNFARNPHPLFSKVYNDEWYRGLSFEPVRGDFEIAPGITSIFTPGHSAGSQSVCVETEKGKAIITGFCVLDDNFKDDTVVIPGPHIDPIQAYDSIVRVKKEADLLIPLHSERAASVRSMP